MTQVKPSSFDIGRKGIPLSQPVSNINTYATYIVSLAKYVAIFHHDRNYNIKFILTFLEFQRIKAL